MCLLRYFYPLVLPLLMIFSLDEYFESFSLENYRRQEGPVFFEDIQYRSSDLSSLKGTNIFAVIQ
jgi:hypothetical protein